ncbi:Na+/H+ antiporter [Mycolicibacterium sediminis]|uniref:Na+/H+ antiporter n=1 Tax=Mycolicibacterium sediminis TaxID=1286180 RepID=A0A7I7QIQ6_9MYCO|nr:Na+/H+ antiporter [Mycolicibacterium sediminis]BBY26168.1 Na+/H+ antiporter [Mycolicibacterium sediminis]
MAQLTLLLALFAATVLLAPVADRIRLPYPVLLLALGLAVAYVPGLPTPSIEPDLILPLVLPPLLFAAARRTSWRQFLDNRRAIGLLAIALVGVTAFSVAFALQALVPGLPLLAAVALGAAVAPPDPVAATVAARELRLPRRLRTTLEGEGLSNDATALVLYEVAVAGALTGSVSPGGAAGRLALSVVVGIGVGLALAVSIRWLLTRLPAHPAGSALVLLVPFAAYGAADAAHGSGVLSVVTLALAMSRYADAESAQTRLVSETAWEIIELLVTGAAFAFVGLELRAVADAVPGDLSALVGQALVITALVIVIRFLWIFPVAAIDQRLRARRDPGAEPVGWRERTIASWAGMRGVVTLAAVLALPADFPEHDRLIFVAFVVIVVTLLLQGPSLPLLVRRLGVHRSPDQEADMEHDLASRARDAGRGRLEEIRRDDDVDDGIADEALQSLEKVWRKMGFDDDAEPRVDTTGRDASDSERVWRATELESEALTAAREAVVGARAEPGMDPTVVDGVLRKLDGHGVTLD